MNFEMFGLKKFDKNWIIFDPKLWKNIILSCSCHHDRCSIPTKLLSPSLSLLLLPPTSLQSLSFLFPFLFSKFTTHTHTHTVWKKTNFFSSFNDDGISHHHRCSNANAITNHHIYSHDLQSLEKQGKTNLVERAPSDSPAPTPKAWSRCYACPRVMSWNS